MGLGVWGLGLRMQISGFRASDAEFLGFRVRAFRVPRPRRVSLFLGEAWVWGFLMWSSRGLGGFSGLGFRVYSLST